MLPEILKRPLDYLKWLKAKSQKKSLKSIKAFLKKQKELSKNLPPINPNTDIKKMYNNRDI